MPAYSVRTFNIVSNTYTLVVGTALQVMTNHNPANTYLMKANAAPSLVRVGFSSESSIYLVNTQTDIFDLPSGFHITSVRMFPCGVQVALAAHYYLQFDTLVESAADLGFFDWPSPFLPNIYSIVGNGIGIRGTSTAPNDLLLSNNTSPAPGNQWTGVVGDYELLSYSWTISMTPSVYPATVSVTSSGDVNLTDIDEIHLIYTDTGTVYEVIVPAVDFDIQTATLIQFALPGDFFGFTDLTILASAVGDGTQFSGEAVIGTFRIFIADASGIYTLVPGQTHDVVYDDKGGGTTEIVKIPNPIGKTGFLP